MRRIDRIMNMNLCDLAQMQLYSLSVKTQGRPNETVFGMLFLEVCAGGRLGLRCYCAGTDGICTGAGFN